METFSAASTANWSGAHPLLGQRACVGMKIISYLDNDELNKPNTAGAPVYAVETLGPISTEQLFEKYPDVFGPGVGLLEGKYHIVPNRNIPPQARIQGGVFGV